MHEKLPYEEELKQQLEDLPLPDENLAWQDMKRRLENDDDNGLILPPFTWGCGGWLFLLLLMLVAAWWILRPEKWFLANENDKKQKIELHGSTGENQEPPNKIAVKTKPNTVRIDNNIAVQKENNELLMKESKEMIEYNQSDISTPGTLRKAPGSKSDKKRQSQLSLNRESRVSAGTQRPVQTYRDEKDREKKKQKSENGTTKQGTNQSSEKSIDVIVEVQKPGSPIHLGSISDSTQNKDGHPAPDSASQKKQGNVQVRKITTDTLAKNNESQKGKVDEPKNPFFSAGIAFQQQIPVGGQSAVPYNSLGRKGSLTDYIPSVYLRYHSNRWFIQSEFRYGAPQYTKQFTYNQKLVSDTFGATTTTTSFRLKKTYYHQIPVSVNYYVLSNLTVGTGLVWNKFYSAISERDVVKRNNITQTESVLSNDIVWFRKDSALATSYFQLLFETQYKWKRFSFGARYSFGLQPYIKFKLPGSGIKEEKNSSVQVFLRYELWRSKK